MMFYTKKKAEKLKSQLYHEIKDSININGLVVEHFKHEYRKKVDKVIGEIDRDDGKWIDRWDGEEMDSLLIKIISKIIDKKLKTMIEDG